LTTITYISDLHLELDSKSKGYSHIINSKKSDIIVLAGDIATGTNALPFIKHLIKLGYQVVYVLGNHEFYGFDMDDIINKWYQLSNDIPELHFLNNDTKEIMGVNFFGSTLWTSLNTKEVSEPIDFFVRHSIKESNDFFAIPKFTPDIMRMLHFNSVEKLKLFIDSDLNNKVCVFHYCPSFKSVHPRYYYNKIQNYMFYTELGDLISYSDIKYAIHGHTHDSFDYLIYNTNVLCNPRGYKDLNMINPKFLNISKVIKI
jgi:Icc-related predicted phosphoesterase